MDCEKTIWSGRISKERKRYQSQKQNSLVCKKAEKEDFKDSGLATFWRKAA
jgi:hypothetical protein